MGAASRSWSSDTVPNTRSTRPRPFLARATHDVTPNRSRAAVTQRQSRKRPVSNDLDDITTWFHAHPDRPEIGLHELAANTAIAPERLRDRLRRLVDQGQLIQSAPIPGVADSDPRYRLPDR